MPDFVKAAALGKVRSGLDLLHLKACDSADTLDFHRFSSTHAQYLSIGFFELSVG